MNQRKNTFYAPDDSGDWLDLGPATKKNWPDGIPSIIMTEQGTYIFTEYAGHVWRKLIVEDKSQKQSVENT